MLSRLLCVTALLASASQGPQSGRLVEEVRWGGTEADTLITSTPAAAALHRSGALVVLLPQTGRVLLRPQATQPFREISRRGQGPGEYDRPTDAGWQGDSIWLWDSGLRRLTWLDLRGKLLRTEPTRGPGEVWPLPDGTWLRLDPVRPTDTASSIYRVGRDRATAQRIVSYSWPRAPALEIKLQEGAIVGIQPFANRGTVVVDPTTSDLLVLEPTTQPARVRLLRLSATGRVIFDRALMLPLQALTDSHFTAALISWREGGGAPHRSLSDEILRKVIYRPNHLPTVRGRFVADDGTLWLQAGLETSDATSWVLVDRDARLVGRVTGPAHLRLLAATGGKVIGALTDDLGLVALVQYRVVH